MIYLGNRYAIVYTTEL